MASNDHKAPWWVRAFTTGGRPTVAVIVMTMCAPAEHHLGHLAGWNTSLAWGMATVLAAYAGIATVVASNRPKGAPGKSSAVAGAFLSLIAAMSAQPVSHLFVTGWLSATPRAPWLLVVAVSCAPPLALGHLLHLAATPVKNPDEQPREQPDASADQDTSIYEQPPLHLVPPVEQDDEQDEQPPLLTTAQVMQHLGVSRATLTRWKSNGKLTPYAVDPDTGTNLYHPDQLTQAG